jgi:MFS family permease
MNKINIRLQNAKEEYILADSNWIHSKQKILKNLFVIGLAWVFLFTAFQAMANLQSSLNSDEGLGTASLSTIYITLVVSCLFLPPIVIEHLGLKWTIVASQCTYLLFIAANVYPKWYLLIPSAVLLGIGAGPLWTAKCTYLTEIAGFYSLISGELNEIVVNRFFGIFFAMFQSSKFDFYHVELIILKK